MKMKDLKKSESQIKHYTRFDLEDCIMDMYRIESDMKLSLDTVEREAAITMHLMRCDKLCDVFESMIMEGVIQ